MKKFYLTLLLVTFSCNLFCQQNNEMVLDSVYEYVWDLKFNEWQIKGRLHYTYNSYRDKIEKTPYRWDSGSSEWVLDDSWSERSVYTYDANRNLTDEIRYEWNSFAKDWTNFRHSTFAYDAPGNLIEEIVYEWDSISNGWILSGCLFRGDHVVCQFGCKRVVYLYNEAGNVIEEINYGWDNETNEWVGTTQVWRPPWSDGGRKVFTYDTNERITEEVIYSWDAESNSWSLHEPNGDYSFMGVGRRTDYHYDDNDNPSEKISYRWDSGSSEWVLDHPWSERSVYAYDANRNQTEEISYTWYFDSGWRPLGGRSVFAYDTNGNPIESIDYSWDSETKDWRNERKVESYWSEIVSDTVAIPDNTFLYALIEKGVDTNGDGLISYAEAEAIDDRLDVREQGITDMTGIEAFVNLDTLNCNGNSLTSLDVSNNVALILLGCYNNQITELDVSNNTMLSTLWCDANQLTSLDVSANQALTVLECWDNRFTSLDVSNNPVLAKLQCGDNQISNLDLSKNTALESLGCDGNKLTSLDVTNNTELIWMNCGDNQFSGLDISNNTALEYLNISGMPALFEVCIWETFPTGVDVVSYDSPNVCFQTDCNGDCSIVGIEESYHPGIALYPNPIDNRLTIEAVQSDHCSINITSLNGQLIYKTEMEGITHQIDLSSFQKGVYVITIRSEDLLVTKRLVKL